MKVNNLAFFQILDFPQFLFPSLCSVYLELTLCLVSWIVYYLILHLCYWFSSCFSLVSSPGPYVWSVGVWLLSHVRLRDPMDCSTPGFPVLHYLPDFAQTSIHWAGDAIQPPPPLSFPSSPTFSLSQHQGLFQGVTAGGQSIGASASASVLPVNNQNWFPLWLTVWSPCCPRDSQESSPTPQFRSIILQCSAFFMVQLSHPYLTTGKTIALTRQTFVRKVTPLFF